MRHAMKLFVFSAVVFVLARGLLVTSLRASSGSSCLYNCESSLCADYSNHSSYCEEKRAECQAYCSRPDAYQAWGAIAYSRSDKAYGSAWNQDTKADATKVAMKNCAQHGANCVLWVSFNKECAAIAVDGNHTGWGTANARYYAKERALKECANNGGRNCYVLDSVCSQ